MKTGNTVRYRDVTYLCGVPSGSRGTSLAAFWLISESLVITNSPAWPAFRDRMAQWLSESMFGVGTVRIDPLLPAGGVPPWEQDTSQLTSALVILSLAADGADARAGAARPPASRYDPLGKSWRAEYAAIKAGIGEKKGKKKLP